MSDEIQEVPQELKAIAADAFMRITSYVPNKELGGIDRQWIERTIAVVIQENTAAVLEQRDLAERMYVIALDKLAIKEAEAAEYRQIIQINVDHNDAEYDMSVEVAVLAKYSSGGQMCNIPHGHGWTLSQEEYDIIHNSAVSFAESKHSRGNGESDSRRLAFASGAYFGIKLRTIPSSSEPLTATESQKRAYGRAHAIAALEYANTHPYQLQVRTVTQVYEQFLSDEFANLHNKITPNE